jgi:hypothetical protein
MSRDGRDIVHQLAQNAVEERIVTGCKDAQNGPFVPRRSLEDLGNAELLDVRRRKPHSSGLGNGAVLCHSSKGVERCIGREAARLEREEYAQE